MKKAPLVATERRILKGKERRFSLTRRESGAGMSEVPGVFLAIRSSMAICLYNAVTRAMVGMLKIFQKCKTL